SGSRGDVRRRAIAYSRRGAEGVICGFGHPSFRRYAYRQGIRAATCIRLLAFALLLRERQQIENRQRTVDHTTEEQIRVQPGMCGDPLQGPFRGGPRQLERAGHQADPTAPEGRTYL